ncbi:MAG: RHS repeat-associated core domain-containing protein [Deltaproteobacteria bacterium]|nr:RHS repeat-associated core domain-containing protein [Deltaproteobacteria bacterium]
MKPDSYDQPPSSSASRSCCFSTLATLLLAAFFSLPLGAIHPNHPLDIDPEKAAQGFTEGIDNIDLYSGALSLNLPIGPFQLNYSSNVWRYKRDNVDEIEAFPNRLNNAGLGFHLGWGEVLSPFHNLNQTGKWLYVDKSGGEHVFYPNLHKGEPVDSGVLYSRDNGYLRLRIQDDGTGNHLWAEIESPNGSTQRFECVASPGQGCGLESVYRLRKGWSPFTTRQDPDFEVDYDDFNDDGNPELWTMTNRYGLTHKIYLDGSGPWVILRVTKVEIQTFGAAPATFDFTYQTKNIARSCKDGSGGTGPTLSVPLLTRIDLPDGTSYHMTIGGAATPTYHTTCENGIDDLPGVLWGLFLPTGGGLAWEWQENEFPPGENHLEFNTSAGVSARLLSDADLNILGRWTYKSTGIPRGEPNNAPENDPQMITEVVYPTGDCSKHFFNARYWTTPSQQRGWELGLPFVYTEQNDGKFLSTQLWDSNNGNGGCNTTTGTKIRSTYLRFRRDAPPGQAPGANGVTFADFYNTNRQVEASRTIFHLDTRDAAGDERYIDTEDSEFDGLGHFRRKVRTGNFRDDSTTDERRETFTGFNRTSGTYPGTYVPVAEDVPWILDLFDHNFALEPDSHGVQNSKVESSFEEATGFLTCTRLLANGSTRGPTDLLTVHSRDSLGNLTDVKQYGGDLYPGHSTPLPTTGGECGDLPAQPNYWVTYGYDPLSGAHISTRPRTATGGNASFLTHDVDVQPETGFVLRQRDTTGFEVSFDYDSSGRLKSATPDQGAQLLYTYAPRTSTEPMTITIRLVAPGTQQALTERKILFDDVGRPFKERHRMPGFNVWTEQETVRNARGWVTSVSEWGNLNRKTQYLNFDALGRPKVIRPPDGAAHDIKFSRLGSRQQIRQVKRALSGGETYVNKIFRTDSYGRLFQVEEPSGEGGSLTTSTYRYDVAGRLTEAHTEAATLVNRKGLTESPAAPSQTRSFQYDRRGFLLSETHPEKGLNGNGSVSYRDYDAAGLPHGMIDGPHNLSFTYDFMGRPLETRDRNHSARLVTKLTWDAGGAPGAGKLRHADQYNDVDLAWNPEGEERVRIRQTFIYGGLWGAISRKETRVSWSADDVRFKQRFTYDDLGGVEQMTYPYCSIPSNCASSEVGSSRKIVYSREKGLLTAVDQVAGAGLIPWAGPITYHTSGLRNRLPHANGVIDQMDADDHFTRRPKRIYTNGITPGFDSGILSYDGAGSLKEAAREVTPGNILKDRFFYDQVGRLTEASYMDGSFGPTHTYDAFGNLQSVEGLSGGMVDTPTNSNTNRLQGGIYDGAGNLLSSPAIPWQFTYNTNNRLTSQAGRHYLYDAFGERTITVSQIPEEAATFHLRDLENRLVSQVVMNEGTWSRRRDFIFADGTLLASSDATNGSRHYHRDHLGSTRLVTGPGGSVQNELFYMPYGGENQPPSEDSRFTGHERDGSTGSDYMHARHYSSTIGRFLSVDPVQGQSQQPQSWNRYAYVQGNPLSLTDPTGRLPACPVGTSRDDRGGGKCLAVAEGPQVWVYARHPDGPNRRRRGGGLGGVIRNCRSAACITGTDRGNGPTGEGPGGGDSPGGGRTNPGPGPQEKPNPPERKPDGQLECAGQANQVICELANDNSDNPYNEKWNQRWAAFGLASVVGGIAALFAEGVVLGLGAKTLGYQAIVAELGGIANVANWQVVMQAGINTAMVIRGTVGALPAVLPGGAITFTESLGLAIGVAGGGSLYAHADNAFTWAAGELGF